MNPFEMVIVIIFVVFGLKAFKMYLQHREGFSKNQSMGDTEDLSSRLVNQEKIIQALKKRVEALESIVIQDDYELNRKFRGL